MRRASPQAGGGRGDRGNKTEEKAKTGGALTPFPASLPEGDPMCLPLSHQPPALDPRSSQGGVSYLRMVCVMDVWRCSTGRRGSW